MIVNEAISILILDDDLALLDYYVTLVQDSFSESIIYKASGFSEATSILSKNKIDVALLDLHLGNGESGEVIAFELQKKYPNVQILFITGYATEKIKEIPNSIILKKPLLGKELVYFVQDAINEFSI